MLGFDFKKAPPTVHVILHQSGKILKQGAGLSFWYFAPICTIVDVPLTSNDIPFIFTETTSDFQELTIQGQITYRIVAPETTAQMLDFTVDNKGNYLSEADENPLEQLGARVVNSAQVVSQSVIRPKSIREVLKTPGEIVANISSELHKSPALAGLGVLVTDFAILAITPTKEMARALESETREKIQQQSDQAIYARRNGAVEEERRIKESELNTEIAIENKRRQIREATMAADIALEEQRSTLIASQVENDRKQADSNAYALEASIKPVQDVDWKTLMAVAARNSGDSRLVMSMAFQELAANAGKIGTLNLSPDLLQTLLETDHAVKPKH